MSQNDKARLKLEKSVRELTDTKVKLTNEKNEAIADRDNTKRYLTAIEREFNWLKRKTEDEQMNIIKLERDRTKLCGDFAKQEKRTEHQTNVISELKNLQMSQENNVQELLSKVTTLTTTIGNQDSELEVMNGKLRESNARFLQMVEECKLKVNMI